jgi:rubrerythrin
MTPKLQCRKCDHKWASNSETKACPFCGTTNIENLEVKTRFLDVDETLN